MKERPILFNSEMVSAILSGRKTQTRRPFKDFQIPKLNDDIETVTRFPDMKYAAVGQHHARWGFCVFGETEEKCAKQAISPIGRAGDRLWVRETFWQKVSLPSGAPESEFDIYELADYVATPACRNSPKKSFSQSVKEYVGQDVPGEWWLAPPENWDERAESHLHSGEWVFLPWDAKKVPSIHMPRWASRITLEITNVRVERLQEISEEDAKAEGVDLNGPIGNLREYAKSPAKYYFGNLWESVYGNWDSNPWVWVIEFKVIKK